jgi:HK97 family phage prohead protease
MSLHPRYKDAVAGAADHLDDLAGHGGDALSPEQQDQSQRHGDALMQVSRALDDERHGNTADESPVLAEAAKYLHRTAIGDEGHTDLHRRVARFHAAALRGLGAFEPGPGEGHDDETGDTEPGPRPGRDYEDKDEPVEFDPDPYPDRRPVDAPVESAFGCRRPRGRSARPWTRQQLLVASNRLAGLERRLKRLGLLPRPRVVKFDGYSAQEGAGSVQAIDNKRMAATFVMSSEEGGVDRQGDIVVVSGIDVRNFLRSPVALFNHDQDKPIGRWENVRRVGRKLVGTLVFAATELGRQCWDLVKGGVLSGVSIGFNPTGRVVPRYASGEGDEGDEGGNVFEKVEVLECSLVSVPANANALLVGRAHRPLSYR